MDIGDQTMFQFAHDFYQLCFKRSKVCFQGYFPTFLKQNKVVAIIKNFSL